MKVLNSPRTRVRFNNTSGTATSAPPSQTQNSTVPVPIPLPLPSGSDQSQDPGLDPLTGQAQNQSQENKPWYQRAVTWVVAGLALVGGAVALVMRKPSTTRESKSVSPVVDPVNNQENGRHPAPIDYASIVFGRNSENIKEQLSEVLEGESFNVDFSNMKITLDLGQALYLATFDPNRTDVTGLDAMGKFRRDNGLANDKDFAEFRFGLYRTIMMKYFEKYHVSSEEDIFNQFQQSAELLGLTDEEYLKHLKTIAKDYVESDELKNSIQNFRRQVESAFASLDNFLGTDLNQALRQFEIGLNQNPHFVKVTNLEREEIIKVIQTQAESLSQETQQKPIDEIRNYLDGKAITWSPIVHDLLNNYSLLFNREIELENYKESLTNLGFNPEEIVHLMNLDICISCNPRINSNVSSSSNHSSIKLPPGSWNSFESAQSLTEADLRLLYEYQSLKEKLGIGFDKLPISIVYSKFAELENQN
ncbi:MAG: hypothetical protein SFU25_00060 [Candidatus Caenarcaniphilales bacterium]|nr:hypothetical protein [Candidatus Caenarcaniphilales bacterium]